MANIISLKDEAKLEIYNLIDKYIRSLPRNEEGSFNELVTGFSDNDVDALRHAYVSGVYTIEFSEETAEKLGRLQEIIFSDSSSAHPQSENMDLWNNAIGRKYGKKAKDRAGLFLLLHRALKNGELIIDPNDSRKYKGDKVIKRIPESLVVTIKEKSGGENFLFYDIVGKKVSDQSICMEKQRKSGFLALKINLKI